MCIRDSYVYHPVGCERIKLLLKNYRLSDDIAFRFSNQDWASWPLDAETYADWINSHHGDGQTVNLFMDYETFGEHQWEDTGIFNFLRALPEILMRHPETGFKTPTETINRYQAVGNVDVPHVTTWADTDRDLTAWTGNDIQQNALHSIYQLEDEVLATKEDDLIEAWRCLRYYCLLYTSPSPRDRTRSRMPSSA